MTTNRFTLYALYATCILICMGICIWLIRGNKNNKDIVADSPLAEAIDKYVNSCDAEIGVCIIIDDTDTIKINNERPYPMHSVMKLYQAVAVMNYLSEHQISLDSSICVSASELKENTYSPLRDDVGVADCTMSIARLMDYSLRLSDNNACDILFNHIVGIDYVNCYISGLGIDGFAICVDEDAMHHNPALAAENWNHPDAAAKLINMLFASQLFESEYQLFLKDLLVSCSTGENRLPKPFVHTNAVIGHKTGTGFDDERGNPQGVNDVGYIHLPNGHNYSVAVFVNKPNVSMDVAEQMIADISELIYLYGMIHPT